MVEFQNIEFTYGNSYYVQGKDYVNSQLMK
jgi:hypothetical protein